MGRRRTSAQPWKVRTYDGTGFLTLVYFGGVGGGLEARNPLGAVNQANEVRECAKVVEAERGKEAGKAEREDERVEDIAGRLLRHTQQSR